MLQLLLVEFVDRGEVGLLVDPVLIRVHAELIVEEGRDHRVGHDRDAFLRELRAHGMHRLEGRNLCFDAGEGRVGGGDARVGLKGRRLGRRRREHDLPGQRSPAVRILGQDVVEDRRAGARHADDDDGRDDPLLRDLGMQLAIAEVVEAVLRRVEDALAGDHAADGREVRIALEGVDEPLEALHELLLAEIAAAAGAATRLGEEVIDLETREIVAH